MPERSITITPSEFSNALNRVWQRGFDCGKATADQAYATDDARTTIMREELMDADARSDKRFAKEGADGH